MCGQADFFKMVWASLGSGMLTPLRGVRTPPPPPPPNHVPRAFPFLPWERGPPLLHQICPVNVLFLKIGQINVGFADQLMCARITNKDD